MKGFTMIEFLITMSIFVIISSATFPVYRAFQVRNDLNATVSTLVSATRRAQGLARGVSGDSGWGVALPASGKLVLFSGSSYATRSSTFDQIFSIPLDVTSSGMTEIDFGKFMGYPLAAGTITLSVAGGSSKTITINSQGILNY